jgi:hypothetical protein
VAEVECRDRSLTSYYDGLRRDFDDLQTSHALVVKDRANLENVERAKVQWFHNQLRKKLAELWHDMEESIATLGGDAWIFPLPMPLSLTCWSGFEWRFNRFLPPLLSAMKISLVLL